MIDVKNCPVCGREKLETLTKLRFSLPSQVELDKFTGLPSYRYERLEILFNKILEGRKQFDFDVKVCNDCGFIFLNPRFTDDEIKLKYEVLSKSESERKRHLLSPPVKKEKRAKRIFSLLSKYMGDGEVEILDYGGGSGYYLIPFVEKGYRCFLMDYVKYELPSGVHYIGREIDELDENRKFDAILLLHVLEHVVNPLTLVKKLSVHLKESGLLYIEVPLGAWREWKNLKEPLTHINFFSEESLYKLVRLADLKVIHLSTNYQWVTHRRDWCINLIASKQASKQVSKYKKTKKQINNPIYHIKPLLYNPSGFFRVLRIFSRIK